MTNGPETAQRLAHAIAMADGVPVERALTMVRAVFRALRADLLAAERVVIPGVLIVERAAPDARRSHRVRFVLGKRERDARAIAKHRAARRARA